MHGSSLPLGHSKVISFGVPCGAAEAESHPASKVPKLLAEFGSWEHDTLVNAGGWGPWPQSVLTWDPSPPGGREAQHPPASPGGLRVPGSRQPCGRGWSCSATCWPRPSTGPGRGRSAWGLDPRSLGQA